MRSITVLFVLLFLQLYTSSVVSWSAQFLQLPTHRLQTGRFVRMSNPPTSPSNLFPFKTMSVAELGDIVRDPSIRQKYQIVDVREPNELEMMAISGADIINLPISEAETWTKQVIEGALLDRSKPLLCLCHAGGRSMKAARFFATEANFEDVTNIEGGISAYAQDVDGSVVKSK